MAEKSDKLDRILKAYFRAEEETEGEGAAPADVFAGRASYMRMVYHLEPQEAYIGHPPGTPDCLTSDQIVLYLSKKLPDKDRARFEAHLARCSRCCRLVASAVRSRRTQNGQNG